MKVLLDTHVWLWWVATPEKLGERTIAMIADSRNTILLSAASSWEIAIKHRLGKLTLPEPPHSFVPSRMARDGIAALPISHPHALEVSKLPLHHRDPFDRMLIAQARVEGVPLLSADSALEPYSFERLDPEL